MLFSRSAEYAIRALTHLSGAAAESSLLSRDIAEAVDLPSDFLSKILRTLTEEGLLVSQRGRTYSPGPGDPRRTGAGLDRTKDGCSLAAKAFGSAAASSVGKNAGDVRPD